MPPGASLAERALALAFPGMGLDEVLALREGAAWRHLAGALPGRFAGLVSVAALDALLLTEAARSPRISMADAGRSGGAGVPEEEFCLADGRVDPLLLFARFDAGATLVASQLQEMHAPLAGFCRGLERVFLHPVQANAYLTPGGAQGFRTHYDTHDVLVLQVEGEKCWRLWPGQPLPHPTRRTPWQRDMAPEGEPVSLTLRPGEALYLPRGVLHEARGQAAGASLHLTIGLLDACWAEALRLLLDRLEETQPALRQAFPSWRLAKAERAPALVDELGARLATLAGPQGLATLALALLDMLASQRQPLPGRGLLTPAPGPATRLRLAEGMLHHVAARPEGGAELRWAGGKLPLGTQELEWLEALVEGTTLGAEGLALGRRLAAAGLVEAY